MYFYVLSNGVPISLWPGKLILAFVIVICHTTSEIREQMGNQLCAYRYKINLLQIKPSKIGPPMSV